MLYSMSYGVVAATTLDVYESPDIHAVVTQAHQRIVDAIAAGDGAAAFRRMERHVRATRAQAREQENREVPLVPPEGTRPRKRKTPA
jgi:GntR family transcriptional repressor for pyruvate dehydrogenase complex